MKRILIVWEEMVRADVWKDAFESKGFEVELCQYFDYFDFSNKKDLIIYDVDVVRWIDGVCRSGRRIGFELFKEKEKEIDCPILFCSITMFDLKGLEKKDEEFKEYVEAKGNQCINSFKTPLRKMIEIVEKTIRK